MDATTTTADDDSVLPVRRALYAETVGPVQITFEGVADIDEALGHYAVASPNDTDMIPYYAVPWPGARALARYLVATWPSMAGLRVLELGCGLALPSLVAARLGALVLATDYHPHNSSFVRRNIELNGLSNMQYRVLHWDTTWTVEQPYDLVVGSDLVYETAKVLPLARCATAHCAPGGRVFIADPGRSALQSLIDTMQAVGFSAPTTDVVDDIFIICFERSACAPGVAEHGA